MTPEDAIRSFEDAVRKRGIIPPATGIVADGKIRRYAVEGTPHKKDGSILLYGDFPISGGFENWRDGLGWQNWTWGNGNGNGNGTRLSAEEVRAAKTRQAKIHQAREQERIDRQNEAAGDARKIWEAAGPASPSHPYLTKKKIKPHTLRMRGDGTLIVPMTEANGVLANLQRIDGNGEKRFLPGGRVAGLFSSFGPTPDPSGSVVIVEGVSTGLSVYEATGLPVVAAMSAENLLAVAKMIRGRYPKGRLIIFADNDTKETHRHTRGIDAAEEAAKACGAYIAKSPTPGDDANDLFAREGAEAVRAAIEAATAAGGEKMIAPAADFVADPFPAPSPEKQAEAEDAPEEDAPLILDPSAPLDCARAYLDRKHTRNGEPTLLHHHGDFYSWAGTDYRNASEGEIRCDLWGFLDGALQRKKVEKAEIIVSFKPNKVRIGDTFDALRAAANVPAAIEPPAFLDDPDLDAKDYLALKNCILNVDTREGTPHTPRFFNLGAADYEFDPAAACPTWERFLSSLFDDDLESRDTLEEILGLFLVRETRFQKIPLIVGPRRAGKGVVGRLIPKLIGKRRVATPTITSLGESFGLQQLIGKTVAVIGDVRLKADAEEVAERLLAISGEDGISVQRKFKEALDGGLPIRFLLLSNEIPYLNDPSGALSSRFIILQLTESFLGKEDPDLEKNLEAELPGILNRCLDGLQRLRDRGRFLQPAKGVAAIEALEALASPHRVFVEEMCEWAAGAEVPCDSLYSAWRRWCEKNGRDHAGTKQRFARDLRTACPQLGKLGQRGTEPRIRVYIGLRLR